MFSHECKEMPAAPEDRKEVSPEVEHPAEIDISVPTVSRVSEVCICMNIISQ